MTTQIAEDAKTIAEILIRTNTDFRNVLYDSIAKNLQNSAQSYTANLFAHLALLDRLGGVP